MRSAQVTRYVTPLKEGGSLPGLIEADDDGLYVMKCRGAGQGSAALVAEQITGELARGLGIRVPELVFLDLDEQIGRREPDPEVQDLLVASTGLNLGLDFLPGSIGYEPALDLAELSTPDGEHLAALITWLDAFTANVDRSWRNPNLLVWHRQMWAIDHGAALVFHHAWPPVERWAGRIYDLSDHVLAPATRALGRQEWAAIDAEAVEAITPERLNAVLELVPDSWLVTMNAAIGDDRPAAAWRERYRQYLGARLAAERPWQPVAGG